MSGPRQNAGFTVLELLVASLCSVLIGIALLSFATTTWSAREIITGQAYADTAIRSPVDALADNLRNAQSVNNAGSYQAVTAAAASDVTIYTPFPDGTVGTTRYWLSGTSLQCTTVDNGTTTTTTIMPGVQTLTLTYYSSTGVYIVSDASTWTASTSPTNIPATLALIAAVKIQATLTVNGYTRQITTFARLRNSPHKTGL